ncbi:MAG: 23S rRNA (uracil(1939)-C(5))-methyltransferase RlmD, partial [Acidobacteria bacterium]|nr:23S rRNA (uracil(1939)-C(5))-methyltransferase RlmD [Acidobacteriota bacterium]
PMPPETETAAQVLDVVIEKMVYGGEGLARTPQGVLLVGGVLPGERAKVQIEEKRHGVRRARLRELLVASPERVIPDCPYFGRCGGCQYQYASYQRQLELKREILIECFERIGKLRLEIPVTLVPSEPWHYRNRTRFQIEKQAAAFQIGYFELSSHRLCPVERCPISAPAINAAIEKLNQGVGASHFPDGKAEIELFASDSGQALLATVYSPAAPPENFGEMLMSAIPEVKSVGWFEKLSRRQKVWGEGFIVYHVGEFHYRVSHDSFFQTNRFLPESMIRAALGDLEGTRALDLYAGVGFFTIPLARRFAQVTAVEAHAASAQDLATNAGVVGTRARACHSNVEKFLSGVTKKWDAVVVDPPRSGLNRVVIGHLCRLRTPRLVYVSCDPTTLARDLKALMEGAEYRIRSLHLVDQFPQTFHVETVVHLDQAG